MENSDDITRTIRKKISKIKKENDINPNNYIVGQPVHLNGNDVDQNFGYRYSPGRSFSTVEKSEENQESRVKINMIFCGALNEIDSEEKKEEEQTEEATVVYNTRALSKDATTYELENFPKKILLIFNQVNIVGYLEPRTGTEIDVEALKNTFTKFGFDVVEYPDLTKDEIFEELKMFAKPEFIDYGCVGVAVLTHGSENGLLRAKDQHYNEAEIINYFNKPTLVTKPKILIIQACRGTESMQGVGVMQASKIRKDNDRKVEPYHLPVESDMLIVHSSYIGGPSIRDEGEGSWFIRSLCNKINKLAPAQDLESIIMEVKREVAIDRYHEEFNRRTSQIETNKQMPVMMTTLIRKLYLLRYKEETPSLNIKKSSGNKALDSPVPSTHLQLQFGKCTCFLDHFEYMINFLRYYVHENPQDLISERLLEVADTFEDEVSFNKSKESMLRTICQHLMTQDSPYHKFLYFYKS